VRGLINRELGAFNSGFEYIIAHSAPPRMFIIHRRTVEAGGKRDKVDAVYWILNERIYPTPSLYDIMANRTVCLPPLFFGSSSLPAGPSLLSLVSGRGRRSILDGEGDLQYQKATRSSAD